MPTPITAEDCIGALRLLQRSILPNACNCPNRLAGKEAQRHLLLEFLDVEFDMLNCSVISPYSYRTISHNMI